MKYLNEYFSILIPGFDILAGDTVTQTHSWSSTPTNFRTVRRINSIWRSTYNDLQTLLL